MRKFLVSILIVLAATANAQQLTNANFEDWSGAAFDGNAQPKGWFASNVTQFGFNFNFAHKEAGRNGGYSMMVQDQDVGAAGITETSPGYFALGQPWVYISSLLKVSEATAGTAGGIAWTYRPDTMSVWIKRTGNNTDKEDFYLLYYAWNGKTRGDKYKAKNGSCTSVTYYDEESDVRQALNGNECGTVEKATQVCEGMWREKKTYGQWTNIRVPIYYMNNQVPTTMNIIFSASNYPNFRANSGLYPGNSLYVDDVELIYSASIQKLFVDDKEWKGFDPNSSEIQTYALGESATAIPSIEAIRGAGSLTNAKGTTVNFAGRKLSGSEIKIENGDLSGKPTVITVKSDDGKTTKVYKIQFTKAASSNAKLASIAVNGTAIEGFSPAKYAYNVALPYGTTALPVVTAEGQEDGQKIDITPATSLSGTATVKVTAPNKSATQTYTLTFSVAALSDNTLQDIRVNGNSIPGFTPAQTTYKVSLPVGTSKLTIEPVSAYKTGEQTITVTPKPLPSGEAINGASVQLAVTTPGNSTPKVYKLNFKLEKSSYSLLKNLGVRGEQIMYCNPAKEDDQTQIAFNPENTTYYINLKMGTKRMPEIFYTQGDDYQTVKVDTAGIDGTTRVTITAGNEVDQTVYKLVFSTVKSEISTLAGIKIGGVLLDGFQPDQTTYTFQLPIGTTELPEIEAVRSDEFQKITITPNGVNGVTRITVTAENGNTTVYVINFSVDSYTDNHLDMIYLNGTPLEGFDPDQNEYFVNLPQGATQLPKITCLQRDETLLNVNIRSNGVNGDTRITVRPQTGASRVYVIHFSVATSSNTALAMILLDGVKMAAFHPDTLHYTVVLDEGVSTIPAVTYEKAEASQRVLSVLEDTTQIITVTAESGAKRKYEIDFRFQLSANALLEMIYLDGVPMENFEPEQTNYVVQLTGETCPVVTVGKAAGQQVTITTPVGPGKAVILVAPEQGTTMQYTITFLPVTAATVQLQNIYLDGVAITSFAGNQPHYETTYNDALPVVTWEASEDLKVSLLWNADTAYINVSDGMGARMVYNVVCTRLYENGTQLAAIQADGVTLPDFVPAKKHYAYRLTAGSSFPSLGYVKASEKQVVNFGQTAEGEWTFVVKAENGDTTAYSVRYEVALYADATLENMTLLGLPEDQTFAFNPETYEYNGLVLDEGALLPDMQITARPGQKVLAFNANANEQQVLVTAQNGTQAKYTIRYTRKKSNNALLAQIWIDGKPLMAFDPEVHTYTCPLPQGTKLMPNVFPIGQLDNQTITTYLSRLNGVTRIHVVAQDSTEAEYTIEFPVEKCTNTKLGSLTINGESKDVNTTEYTFDLPFGSVEPYAVTFEKAEPEQLIEYIEAPVNGVTKIIVTDENGDSRTYSIRYNVAQPQGDNIIKRVVYRYVNASNVTKIDSIVPVPGENIIELPYGSKSFKVTRVDKSYDEQSVIFYNGEIRRGATIIASANREGAEDVTYTLLPQMPEFETKGKLSDLKFKGTTIPNFRPDVYNYMINVTAQPVKEDFSGTAYGNRVVTKSAVNVQKKQITLTVQSGETYSVCWYYTNCEPPFTFEWIQTDRAHYYTKPFSLTDYTSVNDAGERDPTGYKPKGWSVPADLLAGVDYDAVVSHFTYNTGKEVTRMGDKEVMLSTVRGGALNSSLPGAMTLGKLTLPSGVKLNGGTKVSFNKSANDGVDYKNSPEQFRFEYMPISNYGINAWNAWVAIGDGASNTKEYTISGNFNNQGVWQTKTTDLSYTFTVKKLNVLLCSSEVSGNSLSIYDGSDAKSADLQIRNIRMVYNSELTAATVNGKSTTKSGNTFTYNVPANEVIMGLPALKFTGKVHDQMQKIEWLNNGEWLNGELQARVTNYGENSIDSTVYTVVLKREAVTSLDYEISFGTYAQTVKGDTVLVALPYGSKRLPDVDITPSNIHQRFAITKSGNAVKVTVTAEDNSSKSTVYVFRESKTNDALLESFGLESGALETIDAEALRYQVTASQMPVVEFVKKSVGQTIDLRYTTDSATIQVTAEDGLTRRTYTILRVEPAVTTSGKIAEFELDGNTMLDFGGDNYECEKERPLSPVLYTLEYAQDSVVFVQSETKMEWQVYGDANHNYTYSYPTSQSSNAQLANIRINGTDYEEFNPSVYSYELSMDSVLIEAVAAEDGQAVAVVETAEEAALSYAVTVTPEDLSAPKTYTLRVVRPASDDRSLAAVYVDGVLVPDFRSDSTQYTVVLPSAAVKTAQPQMPSITYEAGQKGQAIELMPGKIGEADPTLITVTSEQGASREYSITVLAEPSHCAELTGILVNGAALEGFETGRHYYSVEVENDEVEIRPASADRFQTVTVLSNGSDSIIHVVAEDGYTTADYYVNVYRQMLSGDATLSTILLDDQEFSSYRPELNPHLVFKPMQNTYTINLPSGTTALPEITAQLKMDGQQAAVTKNGMVVTIAVTAADGTPNNYTLNFETPKSQNAHLSMIFLDGDSLSGFVPGTYFYQVELPEGVHSMPDVAGQKGESHQRIGEVAVDSDKLQATIHVTAEDTAFTNDYVIAFRYTQSAADTLLMIYADGDSLLGFEPHTFYYSDSLPVGTTAFPALNWEEVNEWQQITMDTVLANSSALIRQIFVKAENGNSNTYTVSYAIRKSDVDTLHAIIIDTKVLENFDAHTMEYYYQLTAQQATELGGALPMVEYVVGDEYQTVQVSQTPDSLGVKSLGYKSLITVTAATGAMRTYMIHYPVEMSSDATLNMIMLGGKPLSGFDAERTTYRIEIEGRSDLPVVSVAKREEAQTYEIFVNGDTVSVHVTAEDGTGLIYTLAFERILSGNTMLANIVIEGHNEFRFHPEEYEYTIVLPYGEDTVPAFEIFLQDTLQTIPDVLPCDTLTDGSVRYAITVTAPNGDEGNAYLLTFVFTKNNDARLTAVYVDGNLLADFSSEVTEYELYHPYGTDSTAFYTKEDIRVELSDSLAEVTVFVDEQGTISIRVVAQNGETETTYTIRQIISKDTDNFLSAILLNGDTIRDFDPELTFYTHYLFDGVQPPLVTALARSENADVSVREVPAGDTCIILCTAQDGSTRRYYIHFAVSTINEANNPTTNDVLIKRIPGSLNMLVATIRKDVSIALYDQYGRLVLYEKVPVADPNDVQVSDDPNTIERLNDVSDVSSGLVIPLIPGQIYQYAFFVSDKKILKSGKFIAY